MVDVKNRSFLGAIAGAIKALCMLIIKGVTVADNSMAMADKAIRVARKKQAVDLGFDMQDYIVRAKQQAQLRQVKQELSLREFVGDDPVKQALMDEAGKKLDAVIARELAELSTEENSEA